MKFCHVTTFFPPHNFGGDGIFIHRLVNALARDGHQVHVAYNLDAYNSLSPTGPRGDYPNHPNVTLHPLTSGKRAKLDLLMQHQLGRPVLQHGALKRLLEDGDWDVIHFHNISLVGGPLVLKYGKALKFCTVHEEWLVCPMHVLWKYDREVCTKRTCIPCTLHGRRPIQWWRYTGHVERSARHVDAFIGPSQFVGQIYKANGFPFPVRHIPYFLPIPNEGDAVYQSERPYFLFVGRLEKIKGAQNLIEAFREYDKADLLIVGTGNYEDELKRMAGGAANIKFLGRRNYEELQTLYRGAVATLVPSICYETFGQIIIESFAFKTPAIVHDLGALPEVVREGGGFTYKTKAGLIEAMETLRTQPELRREMGAAGHQNYLDHYTEAVHLKMYYGLIEEMKG